jgi:nitrogen fixation protein
MLYNIEIWGGLANSIKRGWRFRLRDLKEPGFIRV